MINLKNFGTDEMYSSLLPVLAFLTFKIVQITVIGFAVTLLSYNSTSAILPLQPYGLQNFPSSRIQ